jgi:hypothetical protein
MGRANYMRTKGEMGKEISSKERGAESACRSRVLIALTTCNMHPRMMSWDGDGENV